MGNIKIKTKGEVFTPQHIVDTLLSMIDYTPTTNKDNILEKHIIDSSCGDGALLEGAVYIYVNHFFSKHYDSDNYDEILKYELEKYIHGIEIEEENQKKCIERLNNISFYDNKDWRRKLSELNIQWDIKLGDALTINDYNNKMDYVVGNPPYVRVHNLDNKDIIKKYYFCENGMTDIYLAFFQLSFAQLNDNGKMAFITPNSWITSNAGSLLRDYIKLNKNLVKLLDFGHYQVFDGITTYSLISVFNKNKNNVIECLTLPNEGLKKMMFGIKYGIPYTIKYDDLFIGEHMCIGTKKERDILIRIMDNKEKMFQVKNGFATLADSIFIREVPMDMEYCNIPVWKSSTGELKVCIYPYNENGKPYTEDEFKKLSPFIYKYMLNHKDKLLERSIKNKDEWYLFGRSQAINDVSKDNKLTLPNIIKNHDEFLTKLRHAKEGEGVYGGIYIVGDIEKAKEKLSKPEFMDYIKALRKYKNGGYYTFSSKDLERYLNNF